MKLEIIKNLAKESIRFFSRMLGELRKKYSKLHEAFNQWYEKNRDKYGFRNKAEALAAIVYTFLKNQEGFEDLEVIPSEQEIQKFIYEKAKELAEAYAYKLAEEKINEIIERKKREMEMAKELVRSTIVDTLNLLREIKVSLDYEFQSYNTKQQKTVSVHAQEQSKSFVDIIMEEIVREATKRAIKKTLSKEIEEKLEKKEIKEEKKEEAKAEAKQ